MRELVFYVRYISLKPFTLGECEKFAADMSLSMSRSDIAECYMILGGILFYWRQLRQGRSLPQNIDAMFFLTSL